MKIFIDTGAFIALTIANDKHHLSAKKFYFKTKQKGEKFITSNFVVCETINYLKSRKAHDIAVSFRENLYKSSMIEVVNISSSLDEAAFKIFKKYTDKGFSFTDCTSFSVMNARKLNSAFAFDRHFEQFKGFIKLP